MTMETWLSTAAISSPDLHPGDRAEREKGRRTGFERVFADLERRRRYQPGVSVGRVNNIVRVPQKSLTNQSISLTADTQSTDSLRTHRLQWSSTRRLAAAIGLG